MTIKSFIFLIHFCLTLAIIKLFIDFQSQNVSVCDIDPSLKEELRKFRFRKATNNAAIISKHFLS